MARWLRPEFQTGVSPVAAVQEDLALPEAVKPKGKRTKDAKAAWPSTTREQIQALRAILSTYGAALPPEDLAKRFQGAKAQVSTLPGSHVRARSDPGRAGAVRGIGNIFCVDTGKYGQKVVWESDGVLD